VGQQARRTSAIKLLLPRYYVKNSKSHFATKGKFPPKNEGELSDFAFMGWL